MRHQFLAGLTSSAVLFLSLSTSTQAAQQKFAAVNVAGVSIKGLDREAATRRLKRELAPKLTALVKLAAGPRAIRRKRSEVGSELDLGWMLGRAASGQKYVPLKLRVDKARSINALRRIAPQFQVNMRPARPVYSGGKVQIRPERDGVKLNVGGSVVRLQQSLENDVANRRVLLAVHRSQPNLTKARLKGVDAILATYTTSFNPGNVKRTNNMRLGIKAINNTLLSPGEVFSLNKTVGERTQARGYRTTIIFVNGYKVPGIGGGISQVTGTLFNAALEAGLPIVSYRTHSQPVSYISLGRDATVAYGSFDMKFKNDRSTPIYIAYTLSGSRATARLYGAKSNKKVSLNVVSKTIGPREIKAQLYRTIRENGKVVAKSKVGNSHYKWNVGAWED